MQDIGPTRGQGVTVGIPYTVETGERLRKYRGRLPAAETFFDTNVLLYLLSEDTAKADRAEDLVANGGVISVQVLTEFAAVASRKLGMSWGEIRDIFIPIRAVCEIEPLTVETHDRGIEIADRYGLSFYDATIVASALDAGCKTLYFEDLQDGQVIGRQLKIRNPFAVP